MAMSGLDPDGVKDCAQNLRHTVDDLRVLDEAIQEILERVRFSGAFRTLNPGCFERPFPYQEMVNRAEELSALLISKADEMEEAASNGFEVGEMDGYDLPTGDRALIGTILAELVAELIEALEQLIDFLANDLPAFWTDQPGLVWGNALLLAILLARVTALIEKLEGSLPPEVEADPETLDEAAKRFDERSGEIIQTSDGADEGADAGAGGASGGGSAGGGSGGGGSGGGGSGGGGSGGGGSGGGGSGGGGSAGGGGGGSYSPPPSSADPQTPGGESTADKAAAAGVFGSGIAAGAGTLRTINDGTRSRHSVLGDMVDRPTETVHEEPPTRRVTKARYVGHTDGNDSSAGEFLGRARAKENNGAVTNRTVWASADAGGQPDESAIVKTQGHWDQGSGVLTKTGSKIGDAVDSAWEAGLAGAGSGILSKIARLVGL